MYPFDHMIPKLQPEHLIPSISSRFILLISSKFVLLI